MCEALQTKEGQRFIPDFLKDTSGTTVTIPDSVRPRPISPAVEVPLGDGLADAAKTSILSRRERIRRAVEGQ